MKIEEIDKFARHEHKSTCDLCERESIVLTQKDNLPEYYTDVFVQCFGCGNWIKFVLPVN